MCWLAPRPASSTGRTSNLAFGNFCRYFVHGLLARHAILPGTVTTTVNRGCCLDVVRTRLRRAWRRGRTVFDISIVLVATPSVLFISLSWCSAISYASRSMLDYAIMDLAHPWAAQYCWFLLRCSDYSLRAFTVESRLLSRPLCSQFLQ